MLALAGSIGGRVKQHPALSTATSPAWSEPSTDGSTGVDFLGTRAVNLEMLTQLTGAYNNVVVSARQHAIMCWATWRYKENCRAAGTDLKDGQFRDFLDAIETIQLAGQRAIGVSVGGTNEGLGSGALARLGNGPTIPLRFKAYKRSHDNTSALAAVQYGPSAKPGSFNLLDSRLKIWWPTKRGEKLALALDPLIRKSSTYSEFAKFPVPDQIGIDDAIELASHGLVLGNDLPERPERAPYITALFDLDGLPSGDHERRLTLSLLLTVLVALGGDCDVGDVRQAFLSLRDPTGASLPLPDYLQGTAARWQLLQLRQLQRYALESWLFWAEWSMPALTTEIVSALADALGGLGSPDDDLAALLDRPSGDAVREFLDHRQVADVLAWASTSLPGTPWGLRASIRDALADEAPLRAAPAILSLTLSVLALCDHLVDAQNTHGFAAIGDRRRISLLHFKSWWAHRATVPLREVLGHFLEELVLQQHVAVAVARFDNEQRRLRFSNDEAGWEMLPGSTPAIPRLTPDRIEALLRLMTDLDLVEETDDTFTASDAGEAVLGLVASKIAAETTSTMQST